MVAGDKVGDGTSLSVPVNGGQIGEVQAVGDHAVVLLSDLDGGEGGAVVDGGKGPLHCGGAGKGVHLHDHVPGKHSRHIPARLDLADGLSLAVIGDGGALAYGGDDLFAGENVGDIDAAGGAHGAKTLNGTLDKIAYGIHRNAGELAVVGAHPDLDIFSHMGGGQGAQDSVDGDRDPRGDGVVVDHAVKAGDAQGGGAADGGNALHKTVHQLGPAGEANAGQMAHLVHVTDGGGVPGLLVNNGAVAQRFADGHLGKPVNGKGVGHAVDEQGELVVGQVRNGAGIGGHSAAEAHLPNGAGAGEVEPGVLPCPKGGGGGEHIVVIDTGGGGHRIGLGSGDLAGQSEEDGAVGGVGHAGDHARLPVVGGILAELGGDPGLGHKAEGPAEHSGHLGSRHGALGVKVPLVLSLDDAKVGQNIDIGLEGGGHILLVGIAQRVVGQAAGQRLQLHGPDQVHADLFPGHGLLQIGLFLVGGAHRFGVHLGQRLQLGDGQHACLHGQGHFGGGPDIHVIGLGKSLGHLLLPGFGDLGLDVGVHSGGPGAEQKGLGGGHPPVGLKGAVVIALGIAQVGHFGNVLIAPELLRHIGKFHRPGGDHRHREGQRQSESKRPEPF